MKTAKDIFSLRASAYQDHRSRMSILPTAVKLTRGKVQNAELLLKDTPAQAVHHIFIFRDIPYLGSFTCDDSLLNEIWKTAAWTVHLNMQNYLWDGIKRDRLAWQGDLHYVEAEYPTPLGIVRIRADRQEDGSVHVKVNAPAGMELEIED